MTLTAGSNPYKKISSKEVAKKHYRSFKVDKVEINGHEKDYLYTQSHDSVGIIAMNEKGEIALVGQWRYPIESYSWEVPAGFLNEGEDFLNAAKRELEEEAGVTAEEWISLGTTARSASDSTQKSQMFLAKDLTVTAQNFDDDEILELKWLQFEEALEMVMSNELYESLTVMCLLKAQVHLQNQE